MKLLSRNFTKDGEGAVKMVPEEGEQTDGWVQLFGAPSAHSAQCLAPRAHSGAQQFGTPSLCRLLPAATTRSANWGSVASASRKDGVLRPLRRIAGEDLWHAYNLIREGDYVTATTFR